MKTKLYLFGSAGRMGRAIQEVFHERSEYSDAFELICLTRKVDFALLPLQENDVVVDYSLPEGLSTILMNLASRPFRLVSGTTGLNASQKQQMKALATSRTLFWAPNTSLGVEVFKRMIGQFRFLPNFEFRIHETHHVHKKDRPSGTALALQEELENAVGRSVPSPESTREGEVLGIHTVTAKGDFDVLELTHRATSRQAFAEGALKVAKWIRTQPTGFYQMKDLTEIT